MTFQVVFRHFSALEWGRREIFSFPLLLCRLLLNFGRKASHFSPFSSATHHGHDCCHASENSRHSSHFSRAIFRLNECEKRFWWLWWLHSGPSARRATSWQKSIKFYVSRQCWCCCRCAHRRERRNVNKSVIRTRRNASCWVAKILARKNLSQINELSCQQTRTPNSSQKRQINETEIRQFVLQTRRRPSS